MEKPDYAKDLEWYDDGFTMKEAEEMCKRSNRIKVHLTLPEQLRMADAGIKKLTQQHGADLAYIEELEEHIKELEEGNKALEKSLEIKKQQLKFFDACPSRLEDFEAWTQLNEQCGQLKKSNFDLEEKYAKLKKTLDEVIYNFYKGAESNVNFKLSKKAIHYT